MSKRLDKSEKTAREARRRADEARGRADKAREDAKTALDTKQKANKEHNRLEQIAKAAERAAKKEAKR